MTYPEYVASITKPSSEIRESLSPEKCNLIHVAMGLSGEAGEYLDTIKKWAIYDKVLTEDMINNLHEEIGDLLFFIMAHCNHFNVSINELMQMNREKLEARYHEGKYSNEQAQQRADKK